MGCLPSSRQLCTSPELGACLTCLLTCPSPPACPPACPPAFRSAANSTADSGTCFNYQWAMVLIFGAFMVLVCQMKDIESSWIISALGASCSFAFSFIAIG